MFVLEVLVDGGADGFSPGLGAVGVDVFVLGEMDGLVESLSEVDDGFGEAGFDVAADDGGEDAGEGGGEIVGGDVFAGEEILDVVGEFCGGDGLGFEARDRSRNAGGADCGEYGIYGGRNR